MADSNPPNTSADLRNALKLRFPKESHSLLWEVANSSGAGQARFADAVAIGLWPSHGHEIEGVEIKVSRGDWLQERANPEKSHAVMQYCHRWWLAVPKGLVAVDELPPNWGLLELADNGSLRVKKKAPALKPAKPDVGFVAAMLRRHAGGDEDMYQSKLDAEIKAVRQEISTRERERAEREITYRVKQAEEGLSKLKEIEEATGINLINHRPAAEWITAIKFLTDSRLSSFSAASLQNLRRSLQKMVGALDELPVLPDE